jgi:hypothetical protein
VLETGPLGRGLFAKNPERPIRLHLPPSLLFPADDIEFVSGAMRIKESAAIENRGRLFFEEYQRDFSWGRVGETESAAFIDAMDQLPSEASSLLRTEFGMKELFQGDRSTRIRNRFIKSRIISWNDKRVVMPVIELANHAPDGLAYEFRDGLQVQGRCRAGGEILVSYGSMDTLRLFAAFGFASPAAAAVSLPLTQKVGDKSLTIQLDAQKSAKRGAVMVPMMTSDGRHIVLSYLMIGNVGAPRLCRGIFRTLMKEAGIPEADADEAFDRILHFNRMKFFRFLAALEMCEGPLIVTLRQVARYTLEAMSHCMGSRQLDGPANFPGGWGISPDKGLAP